MKIYYTDRQGVPVAIDISGKEGKNKITDNSNFFCLGPSGSGKSFHMNSYVLNMAQNASKRGEENIKASFVNPYKSVLSES